MERLGLLLIKYRKINVDCHETVSKIRVNAGTHSLRPAASKVDRYEK
jgi:hypothetical protein